MKLHIEKRDDGYTVLLMVVVPAHGGKQTPFAVHQTGVSDPHVAISELLRSIADRFASEEIEDPEMFASVFTDYGARI